jgi:hypothetical protein
VRRLGGDCATAVKLYDQFLKTNPPPDQEANAQGNMQKCKDILGTSEQPPDHSNDHVTPPPPPPPPPPPGGPHQIVKNKPWYTDVLGDSLAGVGVVGLAVGGVFFASSSSSQSTAQSAMTYQAYSDAITKAQSQRTIAIVGLASGAALLTAGIVRYATRSSTETTMVSIWTDGKSTGLVAFGRF